RIGRSKKEKPKGITMVLEYSTDLFEESTILRLVERYKTMLAAIVEQPELRVKELPIMTEQERQQVLVDWNNTQVDYPQLSIKELFEAQVEQAPERVALVFGDQQMTYGELNRRANQLARYLQQRGVGQQDRVGLSVERSFEMIVGMLGILKAGAAYVPLDPKYPHDRLLYMMEDTQLSVLLTQEHLIATGLQHTVTTICLDADWHLMDGQTEDNLTTNVTANDLACLIYTSGSTGKPKGVCMPQRGIVRLVKANNCIELSADDVMIQFATISFDASLFEIFGSLLNGARLVLFPPQMPSLEEFGRLLNEHQVTTIFITTALFDRIVDANVQALRGIKQLLVGGEVMSPVRLKQALQQLEGTAVYNAYGPTESTTFATLYRATDADEITSGVPIGRPLQNTQLYVLDAHRNPVAIGIPGELYIGGDGLANGYWKQPELTEERFVPNPFVHEQDARLYKTGDLVRYREDGILEYIGRIDNQVKIRGFRIELGEIETVIAEHPAVLHQKVLVHEKNGNKYIVAYVVLQDDAQLQEPQTAIRSYLKELLPNYMVPAMIMAIDTLPLTANGKVDHRALPEPDFEMLARSSGYEEPRNEAEQQMANIWLEILQVSKVGVHDNFFDLGGHSLMATRLISRANQLFAVELSLTALIEHPTVAELVRAVEERKAAHHDAPSAPS
ncbi:MAG: non-ribosomal peptide synthetase, partial [Tumebacillaceae bacterium]